MGESTRYYGLCFLSAKSVSDRVLKWNGNRYPFRAGNWDISQCTVGILCGRLHGLYLHVASTSAKKQHSLTVLYLWAVTERALVWRTHYYTGRSLTIVIIIVLQPFGIKRFVWITMKTWFVTHRVFIPFLLWFYFHLFTFIYLLVQLHLCHVI